MLAMLRRVKSCQDMTLIHGFCASYHWRKGNNNICSSTEHDQRFVVCARQSWSCLNRSVISWLFTLRYNALWIEFAFSKKCITWIYCQQIWAYCPPCMFSVVFEGFETIGKRWWEPKKQKEIDNKLIIYCRKNQISIGKIKNGLAVFS